MQGTEPAMLVYTDEKQWKNHDNFTPGISWSRIVTRSQTAFNRMKKSKSELKMVADVKYYRPPNTPHLMEVVKGELGNIPRTIITRSTGEELSLTKKLGAEITKYVRVAKQDPKFTESSAAKLQELQKQKEEIVYEIIAKSEMKINEKMDDISDKEKKGIEN